MAQVGDVAAYILEQCGEMTAMKLQKLVYYSKAWHLVWDNAPLFNDRIEAWANGPVVRALYAQHRKRMNVAAGDIDGDSSRLTQDERETIDAVLKFYGKLKAFELSDLTHSERPWLDARGDTPPGAPSSALITDDAMYEYYDGLVGA
ncbi:type II toxin-antitoxin system antitoxin SocA domain-containing protein [Micromonospora sp. NPDC048169]|uniref:Panacea domain-containing protein n=1 Tax=Micromonospora sp. NPDC048169 TaxID=3154711 RepID=UPI0033C7B9DF